MAQVEIVHFDSEWHNGERTVQIAINGTISVPFQVHKTDRERFPTEESWMGYLTRSAMALIAEFGDARCPRDPLAV